MEDSLCSEMLSVPAAGLRRGEVTMRFLFTQQFKLSVRATCGDVVLKPRRKFLCGYFSLGSKVFKYLKGVEKTLVIWSSFVHSFFLCVRDVHVQVGKERLFRTIGVEI